MKLFLFNDVEQVSGRYHSGGGLVIIAKDRQQAEEVIAKTDTIEITDEEWNEVVVYGLAGEPSPTYYVFPDAGCC